MKANKEKMKALSLRSLQANSRSAYSVYLFLPRNNRMILLCPKGEILAPRLLEEIHRRPHLELWSPEEELPETSGFTPSVTSPEGQGAEDQNVSPPPALGLSGKQNSIAAAAESLRARSHLAVKSDSPSPLLTEILQFRTQQPADSHSVLVGSLCAHFAQTAGQKNAERIHDLLVAATFHDLALPFHPGEDHGAVARELLQANKFAISEDVSFALDNHHRTDEWSSDSPARFLGLAERFTDFLRLRTEKDWPSAEEFIRWSPDLKPEDQVLIQSSLRKD